MKAWCRKQRRQCIADYKREYILHAYPYLYPPKQILRLPRHHLHFPQRPAHLLHHAPGQAAEAALSTCRRLLSLHPDVLGRRRRGIRLPPDRSVRVFIRDRRVILLRERRRRRRLVRVELRHQRVPIGVADLAGGHLLLLLDGRRRRRRQPRPRRPERVRVRQHLAELGLRQPQLRHDGAVVRRQRLPVRRHVRGFLLLLLAGGLATAFAGRGSPRHPVPHPRLHRRPVRLEQVQRPVALAEHVAQCRFADHLVGTRFF
ncbi:hypothetical protein F4780DRAFT_127429 [Xylariomycetidae sp. FL0641]|nr:hypothetical protein F4780DRAFT_127429 [Xylariomycetidae sp. FL0641]